jgi:nucleoside-diphosphate-sugar epimerase
MRTLIIGGTQFIGYDIARRLVARGHDVSVLHRRDRHELGPEVRNVQANRADIEAVGRAIREGRIETVFDVAYDWQAGTTGAQVEAAARVCGDGLHRYVFMSSIAAYRRGLDRRESDPLAPDDDPNVYATHKASAERALFRMHEQNGLPVTTFRPPFVHGPRQPFYREQFFWDRLLDGRPIVLPESGTTPMQWVFVSDLAEACVRAIERPEAVGQAFNVAHAATTHRGFVEALGRVAGVEPSFVNVSRARIQAEGGNAFSAPMYFGQALDLSPITEIVEQAPRVLGITPTPLDEALRIGFEWYRAQPRRLVDYSFEDRLVSVA